VEIEKFSAQLRDRQNQRAVEFESFQELISKVEAMTNSEEVKASELVDLAKVVREKVDPDIFE
jgi:UDP-N-acetylenolpyruvoylglucosamine reductase